MEREQEHELVDQNKCLLCVLDLASGRVSEILYGTLHARGYTADANTIRESARPTEVVLATQMWLAAAAARG